MALVIGSSRNTRKKRDLDGSLQDDKTSLMALKQTLNLKISGIHVIYDFNN
jgi:hypothetical protein